MVMAASDSKYARRFDWRRTAKPDGQSQLYSVSTVVGVGRHCHYCATADPRSSRRNWQRAPRRPGHVVACRNCEHFLSGIVWRLFRLRDWHPDDRRALSFISRGDIRHVVALKNFLTLCMRGMAILVLVIKR